SPAARTSTTCSSTSSLSRHDGVATKPRNQVATWLPGVGDEMSTVGVSCGALALHVKKIAARRGWDLEVRPVRPELHNRTEKIRAAVEQAANGDEVVVAYAHCGADLAGYAKLPGAHCYEV